MERTKAIELLDDLHKIPDTQLDPDYLDAIQLGKEALERTGLRREHLSWKLEPLLPSETPPITCDTPETLFSLGY